MKPYQADGSVYLLEMPAKEKLKRSIKNLLYVLCMLLMHIAMGMINQPSSRTVWVVFPYLTVFLPLAYAMMGAFTFLGASCRMSSTQYHEGLLRVRRSLLGVFILDSIGIILGLVYIFIHYGQVPLFREVIFIALHMAQLALIIAYGRYYDKYFTRITVQK